MNTYLLLVADHASARLFRMPGLKADWDEVRRLDNPAGHGHERDLGSSAPGRGVAGGGRHTSFESAHTLREHATGVFAQQVAKAVSQATAAEPQARLVLVAGPEMLGVMRPHLPRGEHAPREWPHNMANLPDPELHQRLREALIELRKP